MYEAQDVPQADSPSRTERARTCVKKRRKKWRLILCFVHFSASIYVRWLVVCTILTHTDAENDGRNLHKTQINPNNSVADRSI